MKKNISINISGIIFHIEEDGYESLKKYLDSINRYFSSFEDSSEILADIESRIAEIFLSKLNEEKQVITAEDVNALVTTMGSVSDFKAAEEEDFPKQAPPNAGPQQGTPQDTGPAYENTSQGNRSGAYKTYTPPKRLMRDQKRKTLGGVCSGIANYMNVDAVWIRLLFALLAFAYGITIVVYVVMWIAVPGSYDLDEPEVEKKLFRDADRKVIGGVSGGLSAFLNIDITAIRVLFLVFTFAGGLGIFIYIVMWLILPEARSITDRMQMQGEAVTLSNIESSIKKSQEERGQEESPAAKVLMAPFRLIGTLLQALGKILGPVLELVRVAIGILVVTIGLALVFSALVAGGVTLGILSANAFGLPWMDHSDLNMPVEALSRAFPTWVAVAGFVALLVPAVFIVLLGVSVVAKRIVFGPAVGWSLFVMFFVSIALLGVGIPKIAYAFKQNGEYTVETAYTLTGKRAVLRINEIGMDDFNGALLTLKGYTGKEFKLVQNFRAQGSTRQKAIENAKMVEYHVIQQDSVLTFDSNITFKPDAIFRGQELELVLYIPYDYPFTMDSGISRFITQYVDDDYEDSYMWKMSEARGLECMSCPRSEVSEFNEDHAEEGNLRGFTELDIEGRFDVRVYRGDVYSVKLIGTERDKERYTVSQMGQTLTIEYDSNNKKKKFNLKDLTMEEVRIEITMPSLERVDATGIGTLRFDDFSVDDLTLDIQGPVKVRGEVHTQKLSVNLSGKAEAELSGSTVMLDADVQLASRLKAYDLDAEDGIIEVNGASSAKVNVRGTLEIEEGVASDVDYRGTPENLKKH
jgi:phage shock protein PspC (stress-responsive transcriptional regulator)